MNSPEEPTEDRQNYYCVGVKEKTEGVRNSGVCSSRKTGAIAKNDDYGNQRTHGPMDFRKKSRMGEWQDKGRTSGSSHYEDTPVSDRKCENPQPRGKKKKSGGQRNGGERGSARAGDSRPRFQKSSGFIEREEGIRPPRQERRQQEPPRQDTHVIRANGTSGRMTLQRKEKNASLRGNFSKK